MNKDFRVKTTTENFTFLPTRFAPAGGDYSTVMPGSPPTGESIGPLVKRLEISVIYVSLVLFQSGKP